MMCLYFLLFCVCCFDLCPVSLRLCLWRSSSADLDMLGFYPRKFMYILIIKLHLF
ncbi:hypothetical protein ARMGADRAFT_99495 [Armillaria gallica]|uniref:Uncharacterized protein n=1 Tax=Armillaria gallica TaxID=47427 RepID=A0A2H3CF19_ARMGA|nr:hypothetical protein ARMGADRAFT_99495 [Armillaria gallica]